MAKAKKRSGGTKTKATRKGASSRRRVTRPASRKTRRAKAPAASVARKRVRKPGSAAATAKQPQLNRTRRTLADGVPTPPSSLDMDRHGSAARTGRAEIEHSRQAHATMTPSITAGDVDVDVENAYFSGDEAPGGDNPTPDQEVVEEIGRALGVEYQDNEELHSTEKLDERDKHRWELDPASSEDYRDRKQQT